MAKTKEELQQLKIEYEELNKKLSELSPEEIKLIVGGKLSEKELNPHASGDDVC